MITTAVGKASDREFMLSVNIIKHLLLVTTLLITSDV